MSRSRIPGVRVVHKDGKSAKPPKSDWTKQLIAQFVKEGLPEWEALRRASEIIRIAGGYASESDIGRMSQVEYSEDQRNQTMLKVPKKPGTNGKAHAKPTNVTRMQSTVTEGWVARIARGIRRWREKQGLSVPAAAEKIGMNLTAMYRIERATHPATTAVHLDGLCVAIGMDVEDLFKLGREP